MIKETSNNQKDELIYGYTRTVHELAEIYISRDILKCDTSLINDLLSLEPTNNDIGNAFTCENVENLLDDSMDAVEEFLINELEDHAWQNLSFDERETLAENLGFAPEFQEIYEWWAITGWLAEQLVSAGEPILKNDYGYWWGRTCTGQAIILDGTFQKIALRFI